MPMPSNSPNHFLATLSPTDADLLRSHVKPLHLPQGTFLYKAEDSIERVYFPHTGVISLIVGLNSGQFVEAGMLGRNSVIGAGAPLDGAIAINSAIAQVESSGLVAETAVLKRLARESETLRVSLVRHDQVMNAHTQQVAACNALHELEERLSRWLLQTRDLLRTDTLPLTQEFLSQMLGVQRSCVTLVARKLQDGG
jgi:CRP-like cAMP-binding protein